MRRPKETYQITCLKASSLSKVQSCPQAEANLKVEQPETEIPTSKNMLKPRRIKGMPSQPRYSNTEAQQPKNKIESESFMSQYCIRKEFSPVSGAGRKDTSISPKKRTSAAISMLEKLKPKLVESDHEKDSTKGESPGEISPVKPESVKKMTQKVMPIQAKKVKFRMEEIEEMDDEELGQSKNWKLASGGSFNIMKSYTKELSNYSTSSSTKSDYKHHIDDFQIGKQLGRGKFGCVNVARHKKTGMVFSIKIISKKMVREENILHQLIKQIKIQSFLSHSHIVKLYSIFDDRENVYLLLELCSEGNLYDYMMKKGRIEEQEARQLMKQICEAVSQIHTNKIAHRDIKPENIVMCFGMIKICDFGWSTEIRNEKRETFCGSPLYLSPEILRGHLYDEKVDLWALGILCYEMMVGTIPFNISTEKDLVRIINSKIRYPTWMSPLAMSFLKEVLERNPEDRSSIQDMLQHDFLNIQ